MDYLAVRRRHTAAIWVPAGNTGNVDVVDVATGKVTPVGGFPTAPATPPRAPQRGRARRPSATASVWIGNRADDSVCAVDARTLARGRLPSSLPSMPDGVAYVAATREVWVTTPRDRSITIVDVSGKTERAAGRHQDRRRSRGAGGRPSARPLLHEPGGQGSDAAKSTSKTRKVVATLAGRLRQRRGRAGWRSTPGAACCSWPAPTARSRSTWPTAASRWAGSRRAAASTTSTTRPGPASCSSPSGRDAKLTTARVAANGALTRVAASPTAAGARCVVAGTDGTGYVADSAGGRLIVVKPPPSAVTPSGRDARAGVDAGVRAADRGRLGRGAAAPRAAASGARRPAPSRRPAAPSAWARSRAAARPSRARAPALALLAPGR